mgnify:CR=1 FL=1
MKKTITGIVIGTILFPIIIAATVIYIKKVNEKEQLVLSEVSAFLHNENIGAHLAQLNIVKPGFLPGYNEWYVERVDTGEKYQYKNGEVVKIIDGIK